MCSYCVFCHLLSTVFLVNHDKTFYGKVWKCGSPVQKMKKKKFRITSRSMCFVTSIRYVDNNHFSLLFILQFHMTNFEIITLDPEVLHYSCWLHGWRNATQASHWHYLKRKCLNWSCWEWFLTNDVQALRRRYSEPLQKRYQSTRTTFIYRKRTTDVYRGCLTSSWNLR